jgi:hypothetical protein
VGPRSQNTFAIRGLDWRTEAPSSGAGSSGSARKVLALAVEADGRISRRSDLYKTVDRFARIGPGFRLLPCSGGSRNCDATGSSRRPAETPDQLAQRAGEDPASTSQS